MNVKPFFFQDYNKITWFKNISPEILPKKLATLKKKIPTVRHRSRKNAKLCAAIGTSVRSSEVRSAKLSTPRYVWKSWPIGPSNAQCCSLYSNYFDPRHCIPSLLRFKNSVHFQVTLFFIGAIVASYYAMGPLTETVCSSVTVENANTCHNSRA